MPLPENAPMLTIEQVQAKITEALAPIKARGPFTQINGIRGDIRERDILERNILERGHPRRGHPRNYEGLERGTEAYWVPLAHRHHRHRRCQVRPFL